MTKKEDRIREERDFAWIGDAVLALFARRWILEHQDQFNHSKQDLFRWMTSNQFLSSLGKPTSIEAQIGKLYETQGWDACSEWISKEIVPLFVKQMKNRTRH
ncbi:MAG: ribonuclease III domain-containing protein [Verrucomicrobiota bacterium]